MSGSKTSTWVAGTVLVSLLLSAAGWFLLISPQLSAAGLVRGEAESVEMSNVALADRVKVLEEQFTQIDTFKAELAGLRTQVPADDQVSAYLRTLDAAAVTHGVTLTSVIGAAATDLIPLTETVAAGLGADAAAVAVPAAPAEAQATDPSAADPAADGAAAAPPAEAPAAVVQVPITINVKGGYAAVHAFVDQLQQSPERLLLVTSVSVIGQQESTDGTTTTVAGDAEATIVAYLYALPAKAPVAAPVEGAEAPAPVPLPVPDPGRNPLVPVR